MVTPTKNYFVELVTGFIYDNEQEAINQLIASAADALLTSFTNYKDGRLNVDNEANLIENKNEIILAMSEFKTALTKPKSLIVTYQLLK